MTKLFNKEDILTMLTADKAKIGDNGYFGDNLARLTTEVEHGEVHVLAKIYDDDYTLYPFKGDYHADYFALFLPADKVKKKEPVYRPIKTIDELFNFLMTDFDADTCDTDKKAELLLDQKYQLKQKITGTIYYGRFNTICLSKDVIRLNGRELEYFFENFEIKKDGEWVPFGIKK